MSLHDCGIVAVCVWLAAHSTKSQWRDESGAKAQRRESRAKLRGPKDATMRCHMSRIWSIAVGNVISTSDCWAIMLRSPYLPRGSSFDCNEARTRRGAMRWLCILSIPS